MSNRSELLKRLTIEEECSDIETDTISFELSSEGEAVHIQRETGMKNRPLMMKILSAYPEKDLRCELFQTLVKKLETPFRRSKPLLMVPCGQNLKVVLFLADYHLHIFSRM